MIEYIDVHKSFDVPVLSGVNLTVQEGETLGLVGPSGTGKSVLLKTTIGLIEPDHGDVRVDGRSIVGASDREARWIRRQAGYVFQNAALFDSMTIADNVRLGIPEDDADELGNEEVERRVWAALRGVNLDPAIVSHKLPSELSGGMRKRAGLARAIVGRPRILLYDEPVTGLDPVNTAAVDRLISDIADKMGVTSIVVTHDVEGALRICDRIALLESGRVRFLGSAAEFRRSEQPLVRAFADREVAARAARIVEAS